MTIGNTESILPFYASFAFVDDPFAETSILDELLAFRREIVFGIVVEGYGHAVNLIYSLLLRECRCKAVQNCTLFVSNIQFICAGFKDEYPAGICLDAAIRF